MNFHGGKLVCNGRLLSSFHSCIFRLPQVALLRKMVVDSMWKMKCPQLQPIDYSGVNFLSDSSVNSESCFYSTAQWGRMTPWYPAECGFVYQYFGDLCDGVRCSCKSRNNHRMKRRRKIKGRGAMNENGERGICVRIVGLLQAKKNYVHRLQTATAVEVFGVNEWLSQRLLLHLNGFVAIVSELIFGITWDNYYFSRGTCMLCGDENLQILRFRTKILKLIAMCVCVTRAYLENRSHTYRLLPGCFHFRCNSRLNCYHFTSEFHLFLLHYCCKL